MIKRKSTPLIAGHGQQLSQVVWVGTLSTEGYDRPGMMVMDIG